LPTASTFAGTGFDARGLPATADLSTAFFAPTGFATTFVAPTFVATTGFAPTFVAPSFVATTGFAPTFFAVGFRAAAFGGDVTDLAFLPVATGATAFARCARPGLALAIAVILVKRLG
jgi:hypothetical protein